MLHIITKHTILSIKPLLTLPAGQADYISNIISYFILKAADGQV